MAKVIYSEEIKKNKLGSEYDRPVSSYRIIVEGQLRDPQYYFAWEYFKEAKYVIIESEKCVEPDDEDKYPLYVYHIKVTYPSMEEHEYDMMYGDDYNDFNDF